MHAAIARSPGWRAWLRDEKRCQASPRRQSGRRPKPGRRSSSLRFRRTPWKESLTSPWILPFRQEPQKICSTIAANIRKRVNVRPLSTEANIVPGIWYRSRGFRLLFATTVLSVGSLELVRKGSAAAVSCCGANASAIRPTPGESARRRSRVGTRGRCWVSDKGSSPMPAASEPTKKNNELGWLPIVGAYRTLCIAPPPGVRAVFESIGELQATA